jgi:predicted AAA+ superfamily ATPase
MIKRDIEAKLKKVIKEYPVLFLTGPRQSGKSTLLKALFGNDYKYVSLETPTNLNLFNNDPKGFLHEYNNKVIFDEAQKVPELFSYLQEIVDEKKQNGMFILSGSQNFLMMEKISQSLAGRVAVLTLLPLSISEIYHNKPFDIVDYINKGSYPKLYNENIDISSFYEYYLQTYVERDVRTLKNIMNLPDFVNFMRVCANRVGSLIDYADISKVSGMSVKTVKQWLNILESSYITFRLMPYYKNFEKRIVKSPKLYFFDTGLLCKLLNIEKLTKFHEKYGPLFENEVAIEIYKKYYNLGKKPNLYFWTQKEFNEVDFVLEESDGLKLLEAKSSSTEDLSHFKGLKLFDRAVNGRENIISSNVVYSGKRKIKTSFGEFLPLKDLTKV